MAHQPYEREGTASELERQLLLALCSRQTPQKQIIRALELLANYAWLVPEHAIVFQAIRGVVRLDSNSWREVLPAQATRMGFPEVDWARYLTAEHDEASPLLNNLISRLTR